jgi:hypothetical protein
MIKSDWEPASHMLPSTARRMLKLTDSAVSGIKLTQGKSELIVFDEILPGFGVRIRAGGKRSWVVQYRNGRQQRRLSLGTVGTIDAAEARKREGRSCSGPTGSRPSS